jgi:hypothetical protein
MTTPQSAPARFTPEAAVFTCWKDIARYMGKGVRTVQRWEQGLGLPVRRPLGATHKSAVLASREELDAWMISRWSRRDQTPSDSPATSAAHRASRVDLSERIRASQELRNANHLLIKELHKALNTLVERCDFLARAEGLNVAEGAMLRRQFNEAAPRGGPGGGTISERIA